MPADTANDNTKDRQRFAAAADMIKVKKQHSTSTLGAIAYEFLELARSPFCSPQPASMKTDDTITSRVVVAVGSAYGDGGEDDILHKDKAALSHFKLLRDAVFKGMD
ncbi:hypothetical protein KC340_g14253 [Hortaea werneckii]|nr:hypothetical protein KC342_g11423 [Hortaea werneckii]KAI7084058.1 hypothetical protein KC339_g13035 [Hortaea werneckii]KAI7220345.1 hypothetical protein KC365_g12045 [Hortaea werneckii]KAI7298603.1 hypothetical protein KC340_g14253 [Hortaea werneckii]KAI7386434.1 hypothetical protein KC328_g9890 [Hortaea werneckii]